MLFAHAKFYCHLTPGLYMYIFGPRALILNTSAIPNMVSASTQMNLTA